VTGGRPAVLLDRDGTIIVEHDYLSDPARVELETGAAEGLRRLSGAGWMLVVLTNQSGIARGYFDRAAAERVNGRVAELLAAHGVAIAGWYICPHGPDDGCDCRKPLPGLALRAAEDLGIDLGRSWMIGDKKSDVLLADAVGATGLLVETGHAGSALAWARETKRTILPDLRAAAETILAAAAGDARRTA
jgi:histidinol-phosphate phosphatase family protein